MPQLTVLTPLYNRSEFIDRMYRSLLSQTLTDFQWLVIDDGSRDDSEEVFRRLGETAPFMIEYHRKENGGKHTALNYSHPYIKSDFVLILDSDDTLSPDCVETVCSYIERYRNDPEIGVLSFQRGTDKEHPLVAYSENEVVSDHIRYRIKENRPGDSCEVVRTSVLLEYPFPVFPGERFLVESHLWIESGKKYKTVYIPRVVYINDYQEGGLTDSGHAMRRTCPLGGMYTQRLELDPVFPLKLRIKRGILISYYGRLAKKKTGEILKYSGHPVFVALLLPVSYLISFYENRKHGSR